MKRVVVFAALIGMGLIVFGMFRPERQEPEPLPMNFAHQDHTDEACLGCHHNFVDSTGHGLCIDCHRTDASVAALFEMQFHELCRSCHVQRQISGEDAGPVRICFDCHEGDDLP